MLNIILSDFWTVLFGDFPENFKKIDYYHLKFLRWKSIWPKGMNIIWKQLQVDYGWRTDFLTFRENEFSSKVHIC